MSGRLETGRSHPSRVPLASSGHPRLGVPVSGATLPVPGLAGQCLFAKKLTFTHPRTLERITVECPTPDWFRAVLERLEKRG